MVGYLDRNFVYGTHAKVDSTALGYKYNRTTGALQTIDLTTVVANRLELPFWRPTDDHYGLVCGVDKLDNFHICGNAHDAVDAVSANMHHVVCTNVAAFTNPASWVAGSEPGAALDNSANGGTYTYHWFDRLTNGDALWFMSQSYARGDSRGRNVLAYRNTAGGDIWTPLLSSGGRFHVSARDMPQGTTADRAYAGMPIVDPQYDTNGNFLYDVVYYSGTWRTMDEDAESQQDPFVIWARSTNFDAWFSIDGTPVTMPFAWGTRAPATIPFGVRFHTTGRTPWISPGDPPKQFAQVVRNGNSTVGDGSMHRLAWNGTVWSETTDIMAGSNPVEVNLHRNQHGYLWNGFGRVVYRGISGSPTYYIGGNISTLAAGGTGNFIPRQCPVLLREEKLFLANIGDGDTPRIFTIGGDYPAKV